MTDILSLAQTPHPGIAKAPTGIAGLDAITLGGLPEGRPTLICGAAGCGKTLFALTFLYEGATRFGESGVFMSFEEQEDDLIANVRSLNFDLSGLVAQKKLLIDYVRIEPSEVAQSGDYDLEGLFVRLGYAIDQVGAKRVVLDTLEALFAGMEDTGLLRSELRRLFAWLKDRGVTAIITAERGEGALTRNGLEEYVSDCVILLDHRVVDQVTTRRLRVVKYRGSSHGTNEYPFLIDETGISVLPITSAGLTHVASDDSVPTGIAGLDEMLGRHGYIKGSSVLVSGLAGSGKTTVAAYFIDAACKRGERCLYYAFEEGPAQIVRNMRSVGLNLQAHLDANVLRLEAARPSLYGFEMHLARVNRDLELFDPAVVAIDPLTAFRGPPSEVHAVLLRLLDLLKSRQITTLFTSLSEVDERSDAIDAGLSSLMDTWISLRNVESDGERNRILYLLKARGMSHSNQLREFRMSQTGISVIPAYIGAAGVLTGSSRLAQEARERAEEARRREELDRRHREIARRRLLVERQVAELLAALEAEEAEAQAVDEQEAAIKAMREADRAVMANRRGGAE
jgi:circadian clock protein KaiC